MRVKASQNAPGQIFSGIFRTIPCDFKNPQLPQLISLEKYGCFTSEEFTLLSEFSFDEPNGYFKLFNMATKGLLQGFYVDQKLQGPFSLVEPKSGTYVKGEARNNKLNGVCCIWANVFLIT